jgi:hypothetical protein
MTNIKNPIQRTQAYWYVDGLVELGTGALFLMLGIVLAIEGTITPTSSLAKALSFVRNFLMIGGTIGIGLLVKYIKSRLTYPRTGYIAYLQPKGRELGKTLSIGLVITFIFSLGLILAILYIPTLQTMIAYMPSWLMVGLGIFAGCVYLSWGVRTGLQRFYWLAGLNLFCGLILAWRGRGLNLIEGQSYLRTGPGIFLIVMGINLCISGTVTLRNYLKNTQPEGGEGA